MKKKGNAFGSLGASWKTFESYLKRRQKKITTIALRRKKNLKKGGLKKEKNSKRRLRGWNTQPRVEPHINRRRRIKPPSIICGSTRGWWFQSRRCRFQIFSFFNPPFFKFFFLSIKLSFLLFLNIFVPLFHETFQTPNAFVFPLYITSLFLVNIDIH